MKFLAITSLGFAAVAVAQNSTASAAATGCVASYNTCRQPTNGVSANQAYCASQNAQCQGDCYSAYNTCRQPTNGVSANQASCASGYASCLGENPFSSDGSLTLKPITAGGSSTTSSAAAASTAQCQAAYDKCRQPTNGVSANQAQCAAEFAGCLGTNPFANNGTNTVTGGITYTTEVVTALTTYCPAATTLTVNNKVYTVSSATTLTIKDCPCTISKPVTSATWTASTTGAVTTGGKTNGTATTSKPVAYTGAASHMGAGFGLLGAAAGAVMLL